MSALYLLLIGGVILTVGDIIFKFWIESEYKTFYFIIGLSVYMTGLLFLVNSFRSENIAVASTILVIVNVTTLVLVSWLYFGEKLTALQMLGIVLAFVAVLLLELGK